MEEDPDQNYLRPTESTDEPLVTVITQKNFIISKYAEDCLGCRKLVLDRYIPNFVTAIDDGFTRILQYFHKPKNKLMFLIRLAAVVLPSELR